MEEICQREKQPYFCQDVATNHRKWMGQCPAYREWNTFIERDDRQKVQQKAAGAAAKTTEAKTVPLSQIEMTLG